MSILEIQSLSKCFGGMRVVCEVSLSIPTGSITAIIGPNGAGKTTLFNLINGFLRADLGTITYEGCPIDDMKPYERSLLGIGRVWQDIRIFKNMTAMENLLVAKKDQTGESLISSLSRWKRMQSEERLNLEQARKVLNFLRLDQKHNSLAQNLSYGQQKLLALGRLLMNDSRLLLLDEPTAGVNPVVIDEILAVIRDLSNDGKTIVMIEHNVAKAMAVSDLVYLMSEGRIETSGSPAEVLANTTLKDVYLGA